MTMILVAGSYLHAAAVAGSTPSINALLLSSFERFQLNANGDRLQAPGKERFTLSGSFVTSKGNSVLTVMRQLPNTFRLDKDAGATVYTFDGMALTSATGLIPDADRDLIESLFLDTPDTYFVSRSQGFPYRFFGGHFRTDDGATKNYTGPFYEIYQLTVPALVSTVPGATSTKNFLFDSNTGLLQEVRYKVTRSGTDTRVATVYSGWTTILGQSVPGKISRLENDSPVWNFSPAAATVTAAVSQTSLVQ